jgi:hypothetical protein
VLEETTNHSSSDIIWDFGLHMRTRTCLLFLSKFSIHGTFEDRSSNVIPSRWIVEKMRMEKLMSNLPENLNTTWILVTRLPNLAPKSSITIRIIWMTLVSLVRKKISTTEDRTNNCLNPRIWILYLRVILLC